MTITNSLLKIQNKYSINNRKAREKKTNKLKIIYLNKFVADLLYKDLLY